MKLTFAFCTYNRANRLETLVAAMRAQDCPIPFEILAVDNNSSDGSLEILETSRLQPGSPIRFVTEMEQGIVPARNRAIQEALDSDILVFIDDDELPQPGLLIAAYDAIVNEGAQCAGGCISVDFTPHGRPRWLDDDLLGFLAEVNYGNTPFWIRDDRTPIWTSNIAYNMQLFRENRNLRFDTRYNRAGNDIGGGEDGKMLRTLLANGVKIRYRPDMAVKHAVESWRLKRRYFLKLHFRAGVLYGRHQLPDYSRTVLGIPPFLIAQALRKALRYIGLQVRGRRGALRQGMNAAYAVGALLGYRERSPSRDHD